MCQPLIVDIKRNALDDGPGIRSVVFFKGCPLACVWCQNPEAISPLPEIMFSPGDCLACGACQEVCPKGAVDLQRHPSPIDRERCQACGACVENCPGQGLRPIGKYYPVEELVQAVLRDASFYRNSGGGVTLSGGEATLHPEYLKSLLTALKAQGIHVTLETCGYYHQPVFDQKILPYLDLIYFDIKFLDPELHRRHTGKDNQIILNNFRALVEAARVSVLPRVPLIPGLTATPENLGAIAAFLRETGVGEVALLPYNPMWVTKADNLGRNTPYRQREWMAPEEIRQCSLYFAGLELC